MAPHKPDTNELLRRADEGDASAAGQLLGRHRARLRQMVAVRIDPRLAARVDPSDVVQEALAEASQKLPDYLRHRPLPLYPWLRQIAWEKLLDVHARHVAVQKRSVTREGRNDLGLSAHSAMQLVDRLRKLLPTLQAMAELGHSDTALLAGSPESSRPAKLKTGVLGDFRIVREIGRGGMGVVYEAEQISLGRKVALKVLPFAAVLDPKHLRRFQNEARAAASLRHPSIVQVHSVGSERAIHFYAMDYVEGQTLAEVIRDLRRTEGLEGEVPEDRNEAGPKLADGLASGELGPPKAGSGPQDPVTVYRQDTMPVAAEETGRWPQTAIFGERSAESRAYFRSVAEIGVQVAEALDHAHQHGIIHRDVKPSNVILDSEGKDQCPPDLRRWEWYRLGWLADRSIKTFRGHTTRVLSVAFSPDGKWIASGCADTSARVWNAVTGEELLVLRGHVGPVSSVQFCPRHGTRIVTGSWWGPVKLWDATQREEAVVLRGHTGIVYCAAFSPDGKLVASGDGSGALKLWDAGTASELRTLTGHTDMVTWLAFTPDAKKIVSGSSCPRRAYRPGDLRGGQPRRTKDRLQLLLQRQAQAGRDQDLGPVVR